MDLAGITPEYVQRMWGGNVSLADIEKALAVLKAELNRSLFWPQRGNKRRRAQEVYDGMLEEGRVTECE